MKIGLIREYKEPADRRVALSPDQCLALKTRYPNVEIFVEPSPDRAFKEEEYETRGMTISENMADCHILLAIKEVPIDKLIAQKTYLFFSHTIKAQAYNKKLLQTLLSKNIRMIDYETLVWPNGGRILGFGKWAGIVGTYNAFLTWGRKFQLYELPAAYTTPGFEPCMQNLISLDLGKVRIAFTGAGRVAGGIREVLEWMKIPEWTPEEFLQNEEAGFVHLDNPDIYRRRDGAAWDLNHFFDHHSKYSGQFEKYLSKTDILINGMYWESDMPALFKKSDTMRSDFRIKVIADITCDVEGSVPITMEATDIYHPTFGWSKTEQKKVAAYGQDTIDVMAVTNLPTELPRNASEEFGSALLKDVLPLLIDEPQHPIIRAACICEKGELCDDYAYLESFVQS